MSFIRFKSKEYKDIAVLSEVTDLEIVALTKKPDDEYYEASILVSFEESFDCVKAFFDKYTDRLLDLFKKSNSHSPYLELFVSYTGTPNDSFQSYKIESDLLKILAELQIELVITVTRTFEINV